MSPTLKNSSKRIYLRPRKRAMALRLCKLSWNLLLGIDRSYLSLVYSICHLHNAQLLAKSICQFIAPVPALPVAVSLLKLPLDTTSAEVVASLNALFEGVNVGCNNDDVITCMVTQFLGDWKWHADFRMHLFLNLFSRLQGYQLYSLSREFLVLFLRTPNIYTKKNIINDNDACLWGVVQPNHVLQVQGYVPCMFDAEGQLPASAQPFGQSTAKRPSGLQAELFENKPSHWKECLGLYLCDEGL